MEKMDAYIALRGADNIFEASDVPGAKGEAGQRGLCSPMLDYRVGKTKWVVLRWPTPSMAQQAGLKARKSSRIFTFVSARSITRA